MTKRMLIDAAHREETRVVVADGSQIDDFDFESEAKKQIKGNIYLARVTRVEPSLQAAFVEYGGNRHGFLAFSEIHPDYYQIPVADRERLLAMEAEAEAKRAEADAEDEIEDEDAEADESEDDTSDDDLDDDDEAQDDDDDAADDSDEADDEDAADEVEADATSSEDEETGDQDDDGEAEDDSSDRTATLASTPAKVLEGEAVDETAAEADADEPAGADDNEDYPDESDSEDEADAYDKDGEADGEEQSAEDEEETPSRRRRGRRGGRRRSTRGRGNDRNTERNNERNSNRGNSNRGNGRRRGGGGRRRKSSGDEDEDLSRDPRPFSKNYKIQEVIRRRQVLLVQVAKEERGNKGAALTTYLSLPGRYCVLMPNTARGGGISRKITNMSDRRRLKSIVAELDVPKGIGLIVRTAGANRTKAEIKRDYDYLIRLWEEIRELTLKSSAPSMIYEEGNLIKRSIRDLYSKDIGEVLIEGKEAYTEAKSFMKMLMPSHARNVKLYTERVPLYQRYHVDDQLDSMLSPRVDLPSGGYIIINQTEALVSVDVNSGKSTREHNIEQTALKTNLEAAAEVARQLRLRDLAGLIVIDFIDMEENRNNRAVEREMKKHLEHDRARLAVGRISSFGLMEMSRQRLRAGILEGSTRMCPHCEGSGLVRSVESAALRILRACGEEGVRERSATITVRTNRETAEYILNFKRRQLMEFEDMYGMKTTVTVDGELMGDEFEIDRGEPLSEQRRQELHESETVSLDTAYLNDDGDEEEDKEVEATVTEKEPQIADKGENGNNGDNGSEDKPKRRRRGRRGGRRNRRRNESGREGGEASAQSADRDAKSDGAEVAAPSAPEPEFEAVGSEGPSDKPAMGDRKGWWQRRWF